MDRLEEIIKSIEPEINTESFVRTIRTCDLNWLLDTIDQQAADNMLLNDRYNLLQNLYKALDENFRLKKR